ncbi:MAG: FMN-binding negative transcriptional regulator [Rhodobiaceae bacterium]|nr:FMN-binding negative transcriptional regulator [Rhodobiaceae bacterium]
MYIPQHFREDRPDVLKAAISDIRFAALVTPTADRIEVTHVPMVLREGEGTLTLECHLARANPHWKAVEDGVRSVAIFQGPHAYVSPSWYPSKTEHGKVVPTWVYIAVHAHGTLQAVHDDGWLRSHLDALTTANEASRPEPWQVTDAPETYIGTMSRGIVGVRLTVETLEGSWKLNQHKPEMDRAGTIDGLDGAGDAGRSLATALRARLD